MTRLWVTRPLSRDVIKVKRDVIKVKREVISCYPRIEIAFRATVRRCKTLSVKDILMCLELVSIIISDKSVNSTLSVA